MDNRFFVGFLFALISLVGCTVAHADDLIRDQRIAESTQWDGNTFRNPEQVPDTEVGASLKMLWNYYNRPKGYLPGSPLPSKPFDISRWNGLQGALLGLSWDGSVTQGVQRCRAQRWTRGELTAVQ